MAVQGKVEEQGTRMTVGRRGVIAGAAALAAALIAKQTADPVGAANGGPLLIGQANAGTATTELDVTVATTGGFRVINPTGTATPDTTRDALQGFAAAAQNAGTLGRNDDLNGIGVAGVASNGTGTYGQSTSGSGIGGRSTSGDGVHGESDSGVGVHGKTGSGLYGIVGESGGAVGSAGLLGVANGPNAVGFGTIAQGGATFAGYFNGTTVVAGTFAVTGSKSAAVKDAAGDYRLLYCVESPEAWFEDFGTGTVVAGNAVVNLDPQFAGMVDTGTDYHVFVTPHDSDHSLAVSARSKTGFTVGATASAEAAAKGKTAADLNGTFSYRVVAKRGDIKAERLAKFTMPPMLAGVPAPSVASLPSPRVQGQSQSGQTSAPPSPAPAPPARPSASAASSAGSTQSGGSSPAVQPIPPSRP